MLKPEEMFKLATWYVDRNTRYYHPDEKDDVIMIIITRYLEHYNYDPTKNANEATYFLVIARSALYNYSRAKHAKARTAQLVSYTNVVEENDEEGEYDYLLGVEDDHVGLIMEQLRTVCEKLGCMRVYGTIIGHYLGYSNKEIAEYYGIKRGALVNYYNDWLPRVRERMARNDRF